MSSLWEHLWSIRKWWLALPPNKKQLFREWTWHRRWHFVGAVAGLLFFISLFLCTHLDESPVTDRTRLLVFSGESFMELAPVTAEAYMEEFKDSLIAPSDPRHQAVESLVRILAERNQDIAEISSVPWTVHVVDGPTINAFVLPNGKVFIFAGMLEAVADIHQLLFILGHEMAHTLIGHAAEQASLAHVVELLSLILLTAIWAICPRDSLAMLGQWIQSKLVQFLFNRPFSRKLEAEADQGTAEITFLSGFNSKGTPSQLWAPANDVSRASSTRGVVCVCVISLFASFDDGGALTCLETISVCVFFEICVCFCQACADVRAGPVFWQQMEIYDQLRGEPTIPEWLSTHPSHQNRVRQLDRLVPEALELRARCDCPALPKADPRVIFHQSVELLLDNAKKQEKVAQEEKNEKRRADVMLPLPQSPPVPTPGSQPQLGGLQATSALPQTLLSK
ncbi:metalloendopeptidase OMA1, mitochondrial [Carassius gibelio]|uniref:metalloendopeptidase OMA1, mitochondrial n=1 Tax=Carassius gibelio TaxID=101364 RepID=UPI002277993C|nr:metalloendopeptidase OMA1, mitochondrial [Carassius gibelio]